MKYSEIWYLDFSPKIGSEIDKIRPAIIINPDKIGKLPLKLVIPITSFRNPHQPWQAPIYPNDSNNLSKKSLADCFQIKSVSVHRFVKKIGRLSPQELDDIKLILVEMLDLF